VWRADKCPLCSRPKNDSSDVQPGTLSLYWLSYPESPQVLWTARNLPTERRSNSSHFCCCDHNRGTFCSKTSRLQRLSELIKQLTVCSNSGSVAFTSLACLLSPSETLPHPPRPKNPNAITHIALGSNFVNSARLEAGRPSCRFSINFKRILRNATLRWSPRDDVWPSLQPLLASR
jgi:hypothetical protein